MQILLPVDKKAVIVQTQRMNNKLGEANRVDGYSTYKQLADANKALRICEGMYEVLSGLGLIEEALFVAEDLRRVEEKIESILEEKRRKDMPKWR